MYHSLHRPLLEARQADLARATKHTLPRSTTTGNTEPALTRRTIWRGKLIGLLTTIAMFALPVADALASKNWG